MVTPLSFKGDKRTKKRKRLDKSDDGATPLLPADNVTAVTTPEDDDSWVSADSVDDLVGPIMIVLVTQSPSCLACDTIGKVFASAIENIIDGNIATAEPHDVRQVWIASRVTGTETLTFKSFHGKYLSCDKLGRLFASSAAVSPQESFECIQVHDSTSAFNVKTQRGTLVTASESTGAAEIRGDADQVNTQSTLHIRMQARFKPQLQAYKEERAKETITRKELERLVGRRLNDTEVKRVKRAKKDGNWREIALDLKIEGKHDKFA